MSTSNETLVLHVMDCAEREGRTFSDVLISLVAYTLTLDTGNEAHVGGIEFAGGVQNALLLPPG